MPLDIRTNGLTRSKDLCNQKVPSPITQHLLDNTLYADTYNPNMFTILDILNSESQLLV